MLFHKTARFLQVSLDTISAYFLHFNSGAEVYGRKIRFLHAV